MLSNYEHFRAFIYELAGYQGFGFCELHISEGAASARLVVRCQATPTVVQVAISDEWIRDHQVNAVICICDKTFRQWERAHPIHTCITHLERCLNLSS